MGAGGVTLRGTDCRGPGHSGTSADSDRCCCVAAGWCGAGSGVPAGAGPRTAGLLGGSPAPVPSPAGEARWPEGAACPARPPAGQEGA